MLTVSDCNVRRYRGYVKKLSIIFLNFVMIGSLKTAGTRRVSLLDCVLETTASVFSESLAGLHEDGESGHPENHLGQGGNRF